MSGEQTQIWLIASERTHSRFRFFLSFFFLGAGASASARRSSSQSSIVADRVPKKLNVLYRSQAVYIGYKALTRPLCPIGTECFAR